FASARLTHHAQHFARHNVEGDAVNGREDIVAEGKFDDEVLDGQNGLGHQRNFGLRASRSQSPRRFTDKASRMRVRAGKKMIHHSPENRNCWPIRIRVPSDGWVGGTPTPRKESVASSMMASASPIVPMTRTGPSTLGRMWRIRMRKECTPMMRAAET